jgi:hypothetical protein
MLRYPALTEAFARYLVSDATITMERVTNVGARAVPSGIAYVDRATFTNEVADPRPAKNGPAAPRGGAEIHCNCGTGKIIQGAKPLANMG